MNFVNIVNVGLLLATFLSAIVMIDHMTKQTRFAIKLGAVLLLVGIIAEVFGYVKHWEAWTDTLFFGGAAMCLIANLRFPAGTCAPYRDWTLEQRARSEQKANQYAYLVGALTMLGILYSWAIS